MRQTSSTPATTISAPADHAVHRCRDSTQIRHLAKIVAVTDDHIEYRFDEPLELRATSGAPALDSDGTVVAINVSGREDAGATVGIGGSIRTFRPLLENVLISLRRR